MTVLEFQRIFINLFLQLCSFDNFKELGSFKGLFDYWINFRCFFLLCIDQSIRLQKYNFFFFGGKQKNGGRHTDQFILSKVRRASDSIFNSCHNRLNALSAMYTAIPFSSTLATIPGILSQQCTLRFRTYQRLPQPRECSLNNVRRDSVLFNSCHNPGNILSAMYTAIPSSSTLVTIAGILSQQCTPRFRTHQLLSRSREYSLGNVRRDSVHINSCHNRGNALSAMYTAIPYSSNLATIAGILSQQCTPWFRTHQLLSQSRAYSPIFHSKATTLSLFGNPH